MLIDDLPRLSDEERELADDEYAVMPAAVPANLSIDDLIAARTAALYAMRTAGHDFAAFSRASKQEAQIAAAIRRARRQASNSYCPDCHGSGLDAAEGTRCERCEGSCNAPHSSEAPTPVVVPINRRATLFVAVVTNSPSADLSYLNAKRLMLGFLSRLRQRRQQRRLACAQQWLEACQYAAENHPGLYDDIEREAELAVAKLMEANPQQT